MRKAQLSKEQKENRLKIIEVSYRRKLSHLGSCLSVVDIIDSIYKVKSKKDKFVLSNGHAAIAWYVILEKYGFITEEQIDDLNVHPDRNPGLGIEVSTGSLGQGLPIAVGLALADRSKKVYCLISDGECAEGSIWESLRIAYEQNLSNLIIIVNANGWGAYNKISLPFLVKRLRSFCGRLIKVNGHSQDQIISNLKKLSKNMTNIVYAETNVGQLPFLEGQSAHYYTMNENDYLSAKKVFRYE